MFRLLDEVKVAVESQGAVVRLINSRAEQLNENSERVRRRFKYSPDVAVDMNTLKGRRLTGPMATPTLGPLERFRSFFST